MHPLCSWQTCLHSLCQKFPPSVQFRRLFLNELIRQVGDLSLFITYVLVLAMLAKMLQVSSWSRWELFCCSTGLLLCDVSTAGGRRLWSSGRAIWGSGWGGRGSGHNRMLQELLTGNTHASVQQDQHGYVNINWCRWLMSIHILPLYKMKPIYPG